MSFQAMAWAVEQDVPKGEACSRAAAKFVLLMLANYSNSDRLAYPSFERLAHDTGLTEKTIERATAHLEQLGLIEVVRRRRPDGRQKVNEYRVRPDRHDDGQRPTDMVSEPDRHDDGQSNAEPTVRSTVEPVTTTQPVTTNLSPASAARTQGASVGEVFEVLFLIDCGEPYSLSARKKFPPRSLAAIQKPAKVIADTGISVPELLDAVRAWPKVFPGATCTANAIEVHLPRLLAAADGRVARGQLSDADVVEEVMRRRRGGGVDGTLARS